MVGVLPIALRQRETRLSDEGPMLEKLDYCYPYWQYTDHFKFRLHVDPFML